MEEEKKKEIKEKADKVKEEIDNLVKLATEEEKPEDK